MSPPTTIRLRRTGNRAALLFLLIGASILLSCLHGEWGRKQAPATPEERATAYLAQEVPRWNRENHCYSCHNNGDGARALLEAQHQGFSRVADSLDDTRNWLNQPLNWDHNGGEGGFSDKVLARIQFARALADALPQANPIAVSEAARVLVQDQQPEGYWRIGDGGIGSPCTYGVALATAQACQALKILAPTQESAAINRAEQWLLSQPRNGLVDHVAVLFGLGEGHEEVRRAACAAIVASQNLDGGWGPFSSSASEPFDSAVAILALTRQPGAANLPAIERGRHFLLANQQADGSWIETTRPPGAVSYAQRISTTGWATLALLATRNQQVRR
ncbi:MAG TPA: prenyltransferase/squalene oxidase repeat-containing protein [Gemmataceae bacterium]|nr:prenyltransferase/squalene oxidase repeat-containing protein [Gemmataceae bacterium]